MKRSLSHTPHTSNTANPELIRIVKNSDKRLTSIGSRHIPPDTTITIPYGGYHLHLRHGASYLEQPPPTNVKGVYGSNLIMVECHHTSAKAKGMAVAAKTVMDESPGVYHVSHGEVSMGIIEEKYLVLIATEEDAKFSRTYASESSDSGSDTSMIQRSDDRRQITFCHPIIGDSSKNDSTFQHHLTAETFSKPGISALNKDFSLLQHTTPERKAARAKRRKRKQRRK